MTVNKPDFVIEALRESFDKSPTATPMNIIEKCYNIELEFQYEKDRSIVIQKLKSIVDNYLNEISEVKNAL